ncbi:MAG: hypothetical protein BGO33_04240 [Bacteroidia bacterium 43-41]|nr:MAG: hypothetical protein BGO33_04240 [Bacteroidia bacterium 43-41]
MDPEQAVAYKTVNLFFLLIAIFVFLSIGSRRKQKENIIPTFSNFFVVSLLLITILLITFFPVGNATDKFRYERMFNEPFLLITMSDLGWAAYTYLIKIIFNNSTIYFLITAFVYVIGYYIFSVKMIPKKYLFVFLLACFGTFGFLSYGVNTLRAGFGLSLLLIAIANSKKKSVFLILAVLSVLFHKSTFIPIVAYIVTYYLKDTKIYLTVWFFALIIAITDISLISDFLQKYLGNFDNRVTTYLDPQEEVEYNTGFRLGFVLYSLVPIIIGYYYIKKMMIKDSTYIRFFNMYIMTNSVWLLIMRIIYSDRIAYLSWFLIPIIFLLPLFRQRVFVNQRLYISFILLGLIFFNFIMML